MQERGLQAVQQGTHGDDTTRGSIRAHDAWALELPVLLDTMNAQAVEIEPPREDMQAMLAVISQQLYLLLRPGLSNRQIEIAIRSLLAHYIHRPASVLGLWPEPDGQRVTVREVDDAPHELLEDPPSVTADIRHLYQDGDWAPWDGWRSDDEVLKVLLEYAAFFLKGVVEGIPEGMYPLPDGLGAVVAVGHDSEGPAHRMVFLRGDLPVALRVDLLGFCFALALRPEYGDREPDEHGVFYVGTEAGPVCGLGTALHGALIIQRMGRRPGDCAFRLLDPPEEAAPGQEPAA
ncbi:hypothetical protein [Streptomyces sp. PR69]|uniref:hypothetical protein n=1 Tax=Streptomyces sp. PR69 TaxID=2984950 RepID=UPI002264E0BE|nr:hypothetical protein [Streptomyces sp. PR69]